MQPGCGAPHVAHRYARVRQNDSDRIGMESGAVTSSNESKMVVTGVARYKFRGKTEGWKEI